MLESLTLEGTTVVITGGGTGLGRAMVKDMARAGANLVIAGRRLEPLEEAASEAETFGVKAIGVATDVTNSSQVANLMKTCLDRFGKIDVLLNNAGAVSDNVRKPIWELTDEEWDRIMRVNLTGAFYCSREVSQTMVAQEHGKIINVASGFGLRGGREIYMYCCSKGGMIQLSRVLSFNLARYGITANSIVPGFVPTGATDSMAARLPRGGEFLPNGKLGKPADFGPLAVYLASSASDYMTGEMFIADGGGLAAGIYPTGHAPVVPLEA